jgi:PBSX family phage terminase large subunit
MAKKTTKKERIFDFSDKGLFVPVYRPLLSDRNRTKIIYGGRGSAKSFYAAQHKIIRCLTKKKFKCLMVRKMRSDVRESVYTTIKGVIEALGLEEYFRFMEASPKIVCKLNGNIFIPLGVNEVGGKSGTAKSIFNPTDAIIEEADELTEDEYDKLTLSLRGSNDLEEFLLFNPPNPDHWIVKKYFPARSTFEKQDGTHTYIKATQPDITILHTNYLMNSFCTEGEAKKHEELLRTNPEKYKVQSLGLLHKPRTDGLAVPNFERTKNVFDFQLFNPRRRCVVGWDFNRLPHHTVGIWQMHLQGKIFYLDLCKEFCLKEKSVRQVQQEVNKYLKAQKYEPNIVRYIGDFSGKANRDWDILPMASKVKEELAKAGFRVIDETKPNPSVATSLDFLNDILGDSEFLSDSAGLGNDIRIQIRIHSSCVFHIEDFEECRTTPDGKLLKVKVTEWILDNGIKVKRTYEKRGHAVDKTRYVIVGCLESEYDEYKSNQ